MRIGVSVSSRIAINNLVGVMPLSQLLPSVCSACCPVEEFALLTESHIRKPKQAREFLELANTHVRS